MRVAQAGDMRFMRMLIVLAAALACAAPALADSRIVFGLHFGVPFYWPPPYYYYPPPPAYYYPSPLYYPPPAISAPPPRAEQYWYYYCGQTNAYYPYVRDCPGGWQRVPSVPPPG